MLTLGRTRKFIPPPQGLGGQWNHFPEFLICCSISKQFYLKLKAFRLLKVSVKENEVPTEKNSSRASIFATKASYISN